MLGKRIIQLTKIVFPIFSSAFFHGARFVLRKFFARKFIFCVLLFSSFSVLIKLYGYFSLTFLERMILLKYLDLKVDFMFKQLFGQPSRKAITIAFLNALLHRKEGDRIVDVYFENTELTQVTEDGKAGRLDVLVRTNRGERINVEIQVVNQYDMPERLLYYWARLFSSSLSKEEKYSPLPSTIMIAILNYPLFPHETDRSHTVFHIR